MTTEEKLIKRKLSLLELAEFLLLVLKLFQPIMLLYNLVRMYESAASIAFFWKCFVRDSNFRLVRCIYSPSLRHKYVPRKCRIQFLFLPDAELVFLLK
jgi:hypothetical protein